MAEYIDRDKALAKMEEVRYSNNFCVEHTIDASINLGMAKIALSDISTADVIERSDYNLLRRQLEQTFDRIAELDKLNGELREKIDKAIEEIEDTLYVDSLIFGELMDFKEGKMSADDVIEEFNKVARKEVLDILKKHIGE